MAFAIFTTHTCKTQLQVFHMLMMLAKFVTGGEIFQLIWVGKEVGKADRFAHLTIPVVNYILNLTTY